MKIDPSETRLEFEACLVDNGVYHVHITFQEDGKTININKVSPECRYFLRGLVNFFFLAYVNSHNKIVSVFALYLYLLKLCCF